MRFALALLAAFLVAGCGPARDKSPGLSNADDPGMIVFNMNAGDDLRAIRPDGTGLQPFELRESCEPQDFSRDGQLVACDSIPFGIYLMRRDGSEWRRIPLPPGNSHSPSLSPDGDEFVFLYSRDEYGDTFELWKAGIGGEDAARLVAGHSYTQPAWSPDGTRIAFVRTPEVSASDSGCGDRGDLVVIDRDGGDEQLLAKGTDAPKWSPDGRRLVFMSDCGPTISTVSADGGSPKVLVRDGYHPLWSPDGRLIAFIRETGPCGHATCLQRIFVIPATGGKPRPIGPHVFDPFGFFWLPSSAVSAEPSDVDSREEAVDLRKVDWGNVTVPGSICGATHPVHLRNGRAVVDSARWPRWPRITVGSGWDAVAYGDLDGDAKDEAALGVNCNNGGGMAGGVLAYARVIFTTQGSRPRVLGVVTPQSPRSWGAPLLQVTIRRGEIIAREYWYGPNDGTCCPAGRSMSVWTLKNGKLSLVRTVVQRRPPR